MTRRCWTSCNGRPLSILSKRPTRPTVSWPTRQKRTGQQASQRLDWRWPPTRLGVLAGVFNSIPYFGPIIVAGGLAVVGVMQFGTTTKALGVSAAVLAITGLEGWLLEPPLMGRAERMNVLAVFIGLLAWSWIWGAWGTILAVPMLAVIKAVCDHVEDLNPIGRLLAELPRKKDSATPAE